MTFLFVTATQKPNGTRLPIHDFMDRVKFPDRSLVDFDIIYNNHDGLSKVYNQAIDNNKDVDFLIFVHDDIVLNDCLFFDKVLESKFDVIGAVGGLCWGVPKGFPIEEKPLIWTVATCGQGASGFMNHDFGNGNFLPSSYGPAPAQTITLDGSIIIFTRNAIKKGLRWDEQFDFHFYDIDVCCAANQLGLTVGTANLLLTHKSIGASVAQPEFMAAQGKFVKKYFRNLHKST